MRMLKPSDQRLPGGWPCLTFYPYVLSLLVWRFRATCWKKKRALGLSSPRVWKMPKQYADLRHHNKVSLFWSESKKRCKDLVPTLINSWSSRDVACHKHSSHHLLFTAPPAQHYEHVTSSPKPAVFYSSVKGTWSICHRTPPQNHFG